MKNEKSQKSYVLLYILSLLLFGSNGVAASHISLGSHEIVFLRTVLGTLTIGLLFFLTKHKLTVRQHPRDLLFVALAGAAMAADWLFLFEAYATIGVSLGVLINYTGPVLVVAFSVLALREKISLSKGLALLAAFLGAVLISGQTVVSGLSLRGLACAVLSAVSYAALVLFNKQSRHIVGMENSLIQIFFCFLTVTAYMALRRGLPVPVTRADLPWILWLGVLNTGIGCYLYFASMNALPVPTVALFGYLEPLSGVLFSILFLGERLLPLQILGAVLILGGALWGELSDRKKG